MLTCEEVRHLILQPRSLHLHFEHAPQHGGIQAGEDPAYVREVPREVDRTLATSWPERQVARIDDTPPIPTPAGEQREHAHVIEFLDGSGATDDRQMSAEDLVARRKRRLPDLLPPSLGAREGLIGATLPLRRNPLRLVALRVKGEEQRNSEGRVRLHLPRPGGHPLAFPCIRGRMTALDAERVACLVLEADTGAAERRMSGLFESLVDVE